MIEGKRYLHGTITCLPEHEEMLREMGILVDGPFAKTHGFVEWEVMIPEDTLKQLDRYWGPMTWSLK